MFQSPHASWRRSISLKRETEGDVDNNGGSGGCSFGGGCSCDLGGGGCW